MMNHKFITARLLLILYILFFSLNNNLQANTAKGISKNPLKRSRHYERSEVISTNTHGLTDRHTAFAMTERVVRDALKQFNILDFGAVADGKTLNTKIIQSAINKIYDDGGGKLIFPAGKYLTGSIILKPDVELHLMEGAVLLGSTNPYDYYNPDSKEKLDKNNLKKEPLALIHANRADHIDLTGKGEIDGQGLLLALHIDSLHKAGIMVDNKYNMRNMRTNESMRPKLFRFYECNNVTVTGLKVGASACWGLLFELCSNLVLDSLYVENIAYWNNDGFDITDCRNVRITNCFVNSADDGICLKSHHVGKFNDSVYIANCKVRSGASAVKFGTASHGGFKNIVIENIEVFDTYRSAIAIESVDGGFIENVKVSNINAKNTGNAIFIRLGHRAGENPGYIKNVTISNIRVEVPYCRGDINYNLQAYEPHPHHNPIPSSISGIPGYPVENIHLENIEITMPGRAYKGKAYVPLTSLDSVPEQIDVYPEFSMFGELPAWGFYVRHAKGICMKNIILKLADSDFRPAFVFDMVDNLVFEEISLPSDKKTSQVILKEVAGFKMSPENADLIMFIK